jgi:WD40 repeat protein
VCALSADRRTLLATTGDDGTVRIWDPATGREETAPLTGHTGAVRGVCALPGLATHGRTLLATTGYDGTVRIWDPTTGRAVGEPLAGSPDTIDGLTRCPAPGADCITVAGDGTIRTWAVTTASLTAVPSPRHASAVATAIGPDHDVLLTGDITGLVHVTNMASGSALRPPVRTGQGAVLALCPLPGQPSRAAAAGRSGTITIFAVTAGQDPEHVIRAHRGPVRSLCLIERSGDKPLLASAGNDGTIRIWDPATWTPHGDPLTGHDGWIWSLTAVPPLAPQRPGSHRQAPTTPSGYGTRSRAAQPAT